MTAGQICSYIEAQNEAKIAAFKDQAVLLSGQAQQFVSGIAQLFNRKANFLDLKKLYPKLFSYRADVSGMTPEEIKRKQAAVWSVFLGV